MTTQLFGIWMALEDPTKVPLLLPLPLLDQSVAVWLQRTRSALETLYSDKDSARDLLEQRACVSLFMEASWTLVNPGNIRYLARSSDVPRKGFCLFGE